MKTLISIFIMTILSYNNTYKIDFGQKKGGQDWMIVNDGVMGGLSKSKATLTENSLIFKGSLSLRNNGGFASIRSASGEFDLSNFTTVKLRFRSSGRDFSLRLADSELFFRPNYKHNFSSSTGEWEIATLKISDFKEYTMGKISNMTIDNDKLKNIIHLGIILGDKKEGPFEIEIDYIDFQ